MSRNGKAHPDILLSHAAPDAALAEAVKERLTDAGMTVAVPPTDFRKPDYPSKLRRALARSRAYVPIVSRSFVDDPRLLLEGGAAWARSLPVYLLRNDIPGEDIPVFFHRFRSFPLWHDLPRLIKKLGQPTWKVPA